MTDIGETIAFGTDTPWECPFPHRPKKHTEENYIPPPNTRNDSEKLSNNLKKEGEKVPLLPIMIADTGVPTPYTAQFSAHHLIPGNESWPNSDLYKWIDKRENLVAGDIGYDINGASNGVDLPSHSAIDGWGSKKPAFQRGYAFACIEADSKNRQFHDRHPAYSEFVVKVLNKIAAKLEVNEIPGCGKKNCGGAKTKPFDPPYALEQRLRAISSRLVQYLWGEETSWRKPIMTSRFALMYQKRALRMSQSQARKELKVDNFR